VELMREGRRHILFDLWVENPEILKWSPPLRTLLMEAARASGATILADRFHQFKPYGVTGILLLAESHLSIHTWPEEGLATLDVFTCGAMDTDLILEHVRAALTPTREQLQTVQRGTPARHSDGG
jgi:S-adenosylmethionine decarboxylase